MQIPWEILPDNVAEPSPARIHLVISTMQDAATSTSCVGWPVEPGDEVAGKCDSSDL